MRRQSAGWDDGLVQSSMERSAALHDRLIRVAYALHFAAADTAGLIEERGKVVAPPTSVDYRAQAKSWRAASDQALDIARRWDHRAAQEPPASPVAPLPDSVVDLTDTSAAARSVAHHLLLAGLYLEQVTGAVHGPLAERLRSAIEEIESAFRDSCTLARSAEPPS